MKKIPYTSKTGRQLFKPAPITQSRYFRAENEYEGFCLACGATRGECEPDARRYTCTNSRCGEPMVFGIPELLIMGMLEIK